MPHEEFPFKTAEEFLEIYIAGWKNNGVIRLHPHLKRDRGFRNVTIRDCENIITSASSQSLRWPPEWNEKHNNFVLRIRGRDLDDKGLELVVTVIFENATIMVITAKPDTPDTFGPERAKSV